MVGYNSRHNFSQLEMLLQTGFGSAFAKHLGWILANGARSVGLGLGALVRLQLGVHVCEGESPRWAEMVAQLSISGVGIVPEFCNP